MREKEYGREYAFDRQITYDMSEITPSEDEIGRINPWSQPIDSITLGLIFTSLHFNFLYLQYILPSLGAIMIFLGFRSLRNENVYFKILWLLSMVKLIQQLGNIIVIASPLNLIDYPEAIAGIIYLGLQIPFLLLFHKGLKDVFKNAGKQMESAPLLKASIWTVAVFLIAISPLAESWLIFIPMIVIYILIVKSLFSIGSQLDDTGYVLTNAPVKINSGTFGWTYFLMILVIAIGCNLYFSHLRLEPTEYEPPTLTKTRQQLLHMNFPVEALQYLQEQDVEKLRDAKNIEVFTKLLMFDPTKVEHQEAYPDSMFITHTYEPGKNNMEVSTIYIEMPGNTVYVMQYFNWINGKPIWQDGIVIHGAFSEEGYDIDRERKKVLVNSSLFYRKKGIEYIADFPRIICGQVEVNHMFGSYRSKPIRAALSFPFGSKHQRGYVLYRYEATTVKDDIFASYAIFNYIHRLSPLGLPYFKTEERILQGGYEFLDELNQHYTSYESQALKDIEGQDNP